MAPDCLGLTYREVLVLLLASPLPDARQLFDRFLRYVKDGDTSHDGDSAARDFQFSGSEPETRPCVDAHCPQSASLVEMNVPDGADFCTIRRIDRRTYQSRPIWLLCSGVIRERQGNGQHYSGNFHDFLPARRGNNSTKVGAFRSLHSSIYGKEDR
jgi:hypothetical protein